MVCCDQSILDELDRFYKLKNKYEYTIRIAKAKIARNDLLTKKEKRVEFNKLKIKCVNCKKPGGTIFLIKNNEDEGRKYIAKCNAVTKCNLDVEIILGKYEKLDYILNNLEDYADNIKWNIIKIKLDLLFNYITEENAIEQFNENRSELELTTRDNRELLTKLLMITNNYVKEQNINQNNIEIYNNIKLLKQHIKMYEETDDIEHVKEALHIYQSRILPITTRNQNMKYSNISVESHPIKDNVFVLKEDKYKISDIEYNMLKTVEEKIVKNNY